MTTKTEQTLKEENFEIKSEDNFAKFSEENFSKSSERKLVIPGEVIVSGEDFLPGDFTKKDGKEIISNRYGLSEIFGRVVKIIPISGVYEPRRGNNVIGRVEDTNFSGWMMEIGGPYTAFLPLTECPRFINRNNISEFAGIGDIIHAKVFSVKKGGVDLTLKSKGLGKLEDGRLIKINPHKVPRVIGKEGSMINLIKDKTETEITVGQNGYVWIKGTLEGENKAEETIKLIAEEACSSGLTEKIEKFLGGNREN
jgi:exosome complex component RRP4